jgi:MSHA biogenesis protein MshN
VENLENGARLSLLMDQPVTARAGIETGSPEPVAAVDAGAVVTPGQLTLGRAGIDGLYDEAAALCSDGNVAAGIAKLTELIERDPGHVRGRQLLATVLVQNGDSREAANILDAGLRQRPGVWQWAQLRAQLAVDGGAPVLAHEILARSPPPLADQPDYHAFLAAVQQRIGRHADAVKNYRAVLGQRPERGVWWIGLGISLHALSRDTEAGIAFRRALSDASLTPQLRDFAQSRLASVAITPAS